MALGLVPALLLSGAAALASQSPPSSPPEGEQPAAPSTPSTGAEEAAPVEQSPISVAVENEHDESESPVLGRLRITTDAPATVRVAGEDLGILQPGDELIYELVESSGTVRGESTEKPGAVVSEPWEIPEAEDQESDVVPQIDVSLEIAQAVREARKKERQEGVYADFEEGIMWRRRDNGANVTWKAATRYCDNLAFGGWDDWRLATIDELDTLQAMWSQAPFKTIDPIRLSECCPWSSSEIDEATAWNYNFRYRRAFEGQKGFSYGLRALCVRTLSAEELTERDETEAKRKEKKTKKKKKKKRGDEDEEPFVGTVDEVSGTPPPDDPPGP